MNKINRLDGNEQIRQLKSRYLRFLATKDWDGMRTFWTEDAKSDARTSLTIDDDAQAEAAASTIPR